MIIKRLVVIFLIIGLPQVVLAIDVKPLKGFDFIPVLQNSIADTIPPVNKTTEKIDQKRDDDIIKVVPKARRQPIPLPVVKIEPVKIIKPKIIKPVIKVLH